MSKKITGVLGILCVAGFLAAGCGTGSGTNTTNGTSGSSASGGKSISLDISTEPPNLNPANTNDGTSGLVEAQLLEGLTYMGKDAKPQPGIAQKWDISSDGKVYTFHLRNATWSNGDKVTAQDFVWEWEHELDPKTGTQFANYLFSIKGAQAYNAGTGSINDIGLKAVDDQTLQVTLTNPVPYFLSMLAFWTFYPVDSTVAKKNPKWATDPKTYVGDGPYTLQSWQHQQKLVFQKNPKFWDASSIQLDSINAVVVNDSNTQYQMYKSGQLDMDLAPPLDLVPQLISSKQATVQPTTGTYYLILNTKKAPFNNADIRKALSMAIDRQSLVENVLQGGQQPAFAFVPPGLPGTAGGDFRKQGGDKLITENVAQAQALLKKGLAEEGLTKLPPITYQYNTDDSNKSIAEALQQMWKTNLGITVNLQNEDWKVYLDNLAKGNFDMGRMGWIDTWLDPSNNLDLTKSDFGSNYSGWSNKQYDALVNDAETNMDNSKRMTEMHQAEQLMLNQMPVIPIYYYDNVMLFNKRLTGIVIQPNDSDPDLRFMGVQSN